MVVGVNKVGRAEAVPPVSISRLLGSACAVLPGEAEDEYRCGLQDTIQELGAVTPLQVYLAEKIYETLVWMGRYEAQKRALLIREMARMVDAWLPLPKGARLQAGGLTDKESVAMEAMFANEFDGVGLEHMAADANHSVESLLQKAFQSKRETLQEIDSQIALLAKNLAGLQASYEVLVNRRRNIERIDLQNALMRQDLGAFGGVITMTEAKGDKPQKKKR